MGSDLALKEFGEDWFFREFLPSLFYIFAGSLFRCRPTVLAAGHRYYVVPSRRCRSTFLAVLFAGRLRFYDDYGYFYQGFLRRRIQDFPRVCVLFQWEPDV